MRPSHYSRFGSQWPLRSLTLRIDDVRDSCESASRPDPGRPMLGREVTQGLAALRAEVLAVLSPAPLPATEATWAPGWLLSSSESATTVPQGSPGPESPDGEFAASSEATAADRRRLIALVDLARGGDTEAFGLLYDHYAPQVHRFLYYRTRSVVLAEDLTSETFFRALRSMQKFKWQGRDFGAWLMTIARNLATDHFKSSRSRLELTTEDMGLHDDANEESPEQTVLATLTNEMLLTALAQLPTEQRDCLVMRFLQSMSIAETAESLGRSEGAIKQLQLRAVRNLAKRMPEGIR